MIFGCGLTWSRASHPGSGGYEQGTVGADEHVAHRLDGPSVLLAICEIVREVVIKSTVDHAVGHGRSGAQAFQVLKTPLMHLGSGGNERLGPGIGPRQSEYLMARFDQFRHDRRADESSCTGDKDLHCSILLILRTSLQPFLRFSSTALQHCSDRAHTRAHLRSLHRS